MKTKSNLFLLLILVSSLFGQVFAMDQCKEAVNFIGFGMGCGAVLGAANQTYCRLRFGCNKGMVLSSAVGGALEGAILIGAPVAAASLLGSRQSLRAGDVMIPMSMGVLGLFGFTSVIKEYNYYKAYQHHVSDLSRCPDKLAEVTRPVLCATMLLILGLPGYLVYKRYQNA